MINLYYETNFKIKDEKAVTNWIQSVIASEKKKEGEINYIFCDDKYLLAINQEYLNHNTLTDIISFDYSVGNELHGDVFISVERVTENASNYKVDFDNELARVMVHGILHYCGFKDKTETDIKVMREKENHHLSKFIEIQ